MTEAAPVGRSTLHGLLFADPLIERIALDEKLSTIRPVARSTCAGGETPGASRLALELLEKSLFADQDWRACKPGGAPGTLVLPGGEVAHSRIAEGDTIGVREAWRPHALQGIESDPFGVAWQVDAARAGRWRRGQPLGITYRVVEPLAVSFEGRPTRPGDQRMAFIRDARAPVTYTPGLVLEDDAVPGSWTWPQAASSPSATVCSPLIMPDFAVRYRRKVVKVELVRLLDVDDASARLDGFTGPSPRAEFQTLWNRAYAARNLGTDANPWVWIYRWRTGDEARAVEGVGHG